LTAVVRRARRPGIKFDPIIVLEGPMGTNKSKTIEVLAGVENFSDQSIFGVRDREQQERLSGVWLYEIAELSNIRKTEVEHIKAFASRTHDRAYGPRQHSEREKTLRSSCGVSCGMPQASNSRREKTMTRGMIS
jgi:predicted P-loop ATPase